MQPWPLISRQGELARFHDALSGDAAGLALAGPAGVGKTRLGAELLAAARRRRCRTLRTTGAMSAAGIPFGAFASLLPEAPGRFGSQLELLQAALRAVERLASGQRLAVMVDDAHLLDAGSAALLYELAVTRRAFAVVIVRADEPVPAPVTALWRDGLLDRIDVDPLDRPATEQLVAHVLGAPVARATLSELWTLSRGNPLLLRELVLGARDAGTLARTEGIWRHHGPLAGSRRLRAVVEERLQALDTDERAAVELIAVGEPLGLGLAEQLIEPSRLARLEARGLLATDRDGLRVTVHVSHPLYREVVHELLPSSRLRRVCRQLAEVVGATGARRRDDCLRLAGWQLQTGDRPDPEVCTRAAQQARARLDPHLAARFARAAAAAGGGFEADVVLGEALAATGDRAGSASAFARAEAAATTDEEHARLALSRAWALIAAGESMRALPLVAGARETVEEPSWRHELAATQAVLLSFTGDGRRCLKVADEVLDDDEASERAVLATLSITGVVRAFVGETERALADIRRGLELAPRWRDVLPLEEPKLRVDEVVALMGGGRLVDAEEAARAGHAEAVETRALATHGLWGLTLAMVLLERGRPADAAPVLAEAAAATVVRDPLHMSPVVGPLRALAAAWLGDLDQARAHLASHEAAFPDGTHRFAGWTERAHLWVSALEGDLDAAVAHGLAGWERYAAAGVDLWGLAPLHDVARVGRAGQVAGLLADAAAGFDGEYAPALAAHAAALAEGDAPALEAAAARLEAIGMDAVAAEAETAAARQHEAAGRPRVAAAARLRAARLVRRCGQITTPMLEARPQALTAREAEICRLAADGLSNRAIADRLNVSVRTVENHLHRAYEKLGVTGRSELQAALEPRSAPLSR